MKNNPFLNPSNENPFVAMMKSNPFLNPSEENPFVAMMKNNPFLFPTDGNPFLTMMTENPFILMAQNIPYAGLYNGCLQAVNQAWDMWLVGLGGLSWTQNEIENATRKQLGEMKAAREDLMKVTQEMGKKAAKNHISILRALEDAVVKDQDS